MTVNIYAATATKESSMVMMHILIFRSVVYKALTSQCRDKSLNVKMFV